MTYSFFRKGTWGFLTILFLSELFLASTYTSFADSSLNYCEFWIKTSERPRARTVCFENKKNCEISVHDDNIEKGYRAFECLLFNEDTQTKGFFCFSENGKENCFTDDTVCENKANGKVCILKTSTEDIDGVNQPTARQLSETEINNSGDWCFVGGNGSEEGNCFSAKVACQQALGTFLNTLDFKDNRQCTNSVSGETADAISVDKKPDAADADIGRVQYCFNTTDGEKCFENKESCNSEKFQDEMDDLSTDASYVTSSCKEKGSSSGGNSGTGSASSTNSIGTTKANDAIDAAKINNNGAIYGDQELDPTKSSTFSLIWGCNGGKVSSKGGCNVNDAIKQIQKLVNWGFFMVVPISTLLFAYAGFLYLTASFNGNKNLAKANTIFKNTIIAFLVAASAWAIVHFVINFLVTESVKNEINTLIQ